MRAPGNILRFHLNLFLHAMFIQETLGTKAKQLTSEELFGKYYLALIRHAAEQYCIISGRSLNAEKEEATFNLIKTITNNTSNQWPNHVINNAFIRIRVSEERFEKHEKKNQMDSKISKM